MRTVIRRSMFLVALSIAVSACGGLDAEDAFRTDSGSVTFDQLVDFSATLIEPSTQGGATADANTLRTAGALWVTTAAEVQALGENGVSMSDAESLDTEQQLQIAISNNQVGPIDPSSPAYGAVVEFAWTRLDPEAANALQTDADVRDRVITLLLGDVDAASRFGSWDPTAFQFVGPSAAG